MSSIIPGYEYDIFISYRQKDNKYDGWVTEFVENLKKELEELKQQSNTTTSGSPAFYSAMIYSAMGNADQSFDWLEKAYTLHEVELYWLKVEPPFEPIRSDPRFQEMLDKVGFSK